MNKQTFATILNVALLSYDGVSENVMIFEFGLDSNLVNTGIKLCNYLKNQK